MTDCNIFLNFGCSKGALLDEQRLCYMKNINSSDLQVWLLTGFGSTTGCAATCFFVISSTYIISYKNMCSSNIVIFWTWIVNLILVTNHKGKIVIQFCIMMWRQISGEWWCCLFLTNIDCWAFFGALLWGTLWGFSNYPALHISNPEHIPITLHSKSLS